MKTVFLAINSQYVHTLLAPRYLKANSPLPVEIVETNVNVQLSSVFSQLYLKKPDVVAISCYIFNIAFVDRLLQDIRLYLPDVKIILGGYEAAFDEEKYVGKADYIIKGEGDFVFGRLLQDIESGEGRFSKIIEAGQVSNLDDIVSPYDDEYAMMGDNRILYMESSRGCPFRCSYCMSGGTRPRTFSLQRTFDDYRRLMKYNPRQIKMVDRTFNFDVKRATKIFDWLIDNYGESNTNFHFEMAPELFDDEMFEVLSRAKKGLFQFEIGVQSFNKSTLSAVGRCADVDKIAANLARLKKMGNIHIHTDLIAGLPHEDYDSFVRGFDRLFVMGGDCLQLGFLKVLKGSRLQKDSDGYVIGSLPPYEIVSSPCLSFDDVLALKTCESALERYHNSGRFATCIDFLVPKYYSPYAFFYGLGEYIAARRGDRVAISAPAQCDLLWQYVADNLPSNLADEQAKYDFMQRLEECIQTDYKRCGNARSWHRHDNKN
ncbi:MAG: DUF4080 domain-containing protein [Christensenellales bacterium]